MQKSIDPTDNMMSIKILPGEFYVTNQNEKIETILGSCIAACVYDPVARVGGMNHFMLPMDRQMNQQTRSELADANRYGNFAMENLINALLKLGAQRSRLEFKVFGGGRIMEKGANIGWNNIGFTFDYIYTEGFAVKSQDIGDIYPRKIVFYPTTGRVRVRKLDAVRNESIVQQEAAYRNTVNQQPVEGDIELF